MPLQALKKTVIFTAQKTGVAPVLTNRTKHFKTPSSHNNNDFGFLKG